ncbi:MAG: 1-acyl-sn-glycerol-3-phosphate acyltransferase [Anaerolineaceae bacterium]|nr:1-acyl-sn-glycerol-3-phosphate acyltransferase [Anaerolineaceae bacterium]
MAASPHLRADHGLAGAIYINRGEVDRQGLRDALAAIERGVVFGLAPEGSRSKTGQMQEAKVGAAYLANRANIPILPVGFENNDQLLPISSSCALRAPFCALASLICCQKSAVGPKGPIWRRSPISLW